MGGDPLIGTILGKDYSVVEEIGRGGMAVVYLVEHQKLHKQFAAKVLSTELAANLEARARFTQEAHAASQLDHENIVTISDFGVTSDQRPYFVMELLRGETLDQRLAKGPMAVEEIVAVVVPLARALAHAHAEGVVHRDVKPENVFLVQRSQGRFGVRVVDFGIAKAPVHNNRLTKMGQTLGSPMFMAPEACRGEDVDHRADIYSFGILLYLMFCNRLPFEDESLLKVLQMQSMAPLPPPQTVNPAVPAAIARVIETALVKDAANRYPSMLDLLDAFEEAVPVGADRLLLEQQRGSTHAIRRTPFPGVTLDAPFQSGALPVVARERSTSTSPPLSAPPSHPPSHPPAPQARRKGLLAVVALSVVFGLFGVVFAVQRLSSNKKPAGGAVEAAARPQPSGTPTPDSALPARNVRAFVPEEGSAGSGTAPSSTKAALVKLKVATTPPGSTVSVGGKRLGVTPLEIAVDRQAAPSELVISQPGYADVIRSLALSEDVTLALELVPIKTVATTKPRPGPPPKKPDKADKPVKTDKTEKVIPKNGEQPLDIRMAR